MDRYIWHLTLIFFTVHVGDKRWKEEEENSVAMSELKQKHIADAADENKFVFLR